MPEVAAIKYRQQTPIADPAREQDVLDRTVAEAAALNLDGPAAREFLGVQIRMARAVQEACFTRWQAATAPPPPARDLVTVLRPELDALVRELLPAVYLATDALANASASHRRTALEPLRRHAGLTDALISELAGSLGALRVTAPATWPVLQRVGVLRVGTTGDYAPFSDDRERVLRGFDIELAGALAHDWGVEVMFVRTSWPTLMDDLRRRRFDLAASDISVTEERRRVADFSGPYFFDGKTPIARRNDAARFSRLEDIDRPDVRVVVNPGGTNERFAREHLRRATLRIHPDNRTIFAEIAAGRADVMITDGVEVRLQERRQPELRGTRAEPFTRTGKAVLLPAGSELTVRVDAWLEPRLKSGELATRLERALDDAAAPGAR